MKPNRKLITIAGIATMLSMAGCVGTGPNTQQDAVAGGAVGALAGGIIGNQSHNAFGGALLGGAIGAIAGGTIGNSVDQTNGTVYPNETVTYVYQDGVVPPEPAPRIEVVTVSPGPDYAWIDGYWAWDANQYVWIPGLWSIHPAGYFYARPHWEYRGGRRAFVRGGWRR